MIKHFLVFLQEVIDSLARGYEENLKCDYLILEINSSRYAYNIQLDEVNFFVVRALLSMPILENTKSVLVTIKDILKFFRPVISNYIKTKSSIMDCLKAVEVSIKLENFMYVYINVILKIILKIFFFRIVALKMHGLMAELAKLSICCMKQILWTRIPCCNGMRISRKMKAHSKIKLQL